LFPEIVGGGSPPTGLRTVASSRADRTHPTNGSSSPQKVQQPAGIAVLHQALSTINPALDR